MKKPTTFEQQIKLLKKRGVKSIDDTYFEHFLNEVNYFRLTGYCKLFALNTSKDKFIDGLTMNKLVNIYKFDCKLRNTINDVLDVIEISVKTQIAYHLSHKLSPYFYLNSHNFIDKKYYKKMVNVIEECIKKNTNEKPIEHYSSTQIPIWVLVEYLSLGTVSRMYYNLKTEYKKMVSNASLYSINYEYFANYLIVLSYLRNATSHRSRLYGRGHPCNPKFSSDEIRLLNIDYSKNYVCTLFMCLFIIVKLIPNSLLKQKFINELEFTINKYNKYIDLSKIGFPKNWKQILNKSE